MLSITDVVANMLLKKGLIGEVRNFETTIDIPQGSEKAPIKMVIKADHLQVRLDNKQEKETPTYTPYTERKEG